MLSTEFTGGSANVSQKPIGWEECVNKEQVHYTSGKVVKGQTDKCSALVWAENAESTVLQN